MEISHKNRAAHKLILCGSPLLISQPFVHFMEIPEISQPYFKVLIAELSDDPVIPALLPQKDGRKRHTVEGIGFHHGIDRHILKYQPVPLP